MSRGREANLTRAVDSAGVHLEKLDVRAREFRSFVRTVAPDVVVHLAAQIDVRRAAQDPIDDADQNILGTLSVFEAAREAGTQTVLIASSGGTIYGEPRKLPIREDSRSRPTSPYGISKRVLHDYAAFYGAAYGLRTVLLFVGRISPNKRQDDLVRMLAYYRRCIDPEAHLVLVGAFRDQPQYHARIVALIERLGLGGALGWSVGSGFGGCGVGLLLVRAGFRW